MSQKPDRRASRASIPDVARPLQRDVVMMRRRPIEPLLDKLAQLQIRRPWIVILAVLLSLFPAAFAASRLELKTAFSELLPDDKPSVVELRRVNERMAGMSTLTVVMQGGGVPKLEAHGGRGVPAHPRAGTRQRDGRG